VSRSLRSLAVAVVVVAIVIGGPEVWAVRSASSADAQLEQQIEAILRLNPASHQVSRNAVQLEKDVVMTVIPRLETPGVVTAQAGELCSYHWLCLYQEWGGLGYLISFAACRFYNLGDWLMPNGQRWNDQVSSVSNNQTPGVWSYFYDWSPPGTSGWFYLNALKAPGHWSNLALDKAWDGSRMNDRIDGVLVC
jgi:hypothetical protein